MTTADVEQLRQVILNLSSNDNKIREGAETALKVQWKTRPDILVKGLASIISSDANPTSRSLASVLLRRTISEYVAMPLQSTTLAKTPVRYWNTISPDIQRQVSTDLLQTWCQEPQAEVRNQVSDLIAEVARCVLIYSKSWPELSKHLLQVASQSITTCNLPGVMAVMRVLAAVPECVISTEPLSSSDLTSIVQLLEGGLFHLSGPNLMEVGKAKVATLKALHSIISTTTDDIKMTLGKHLVSKLSELIISMAQMGPGIEDELSEALQTLIAMVEECPKLFRTSAPSLANIMIQIIRSPPVTEASELKETAIELTTALIEQMAAFFKKSANASALASIVTLFVEVAGWGLVSEDEWTQASPDDELEEESLALAAEQALDRVALAIGSKALLPTLLSLIPSLVSSADWTRRYAGLRAIANIAEGCADSLEDRLGEVLNLVWPAFHDTHPRVQYAACHALGQLCTDFTGTLQENFATSCLNNLVGLLSTSTHSRVQCHAAAALINFAEGVESTTIAPILEPLLARLVGLLAGNGSVLYLQEQVLATLAAFSTAAGKSFNPSLPLIMPILLSALQSSPNSNATDRFRLLQARALESATMVGVAVGREAFAPFTKPVVDVMIALQGQELDDADQMIEYLAAAWVRICQLLEADFAPFIPLVLPNILEAAAAEPDVTVVEDDGEEAEYDPAEWEFATIKGKRLGIHTATLDAKCAAVENLAIYIGAMGVAFAPHVSSAYATLLPLLSFKMHEGVQMAAADALANLIKYQLGLDVAAGERMAQETLSRILDGLEKNENDAEVQVGLIDAMTDILNLTDTNKDQLSTKHGLRMAPEHFVPRSFNIINGLLTVLIQHQNGISRSNEEDGHDEEDGVEDNDNDESVMYAISRWAATLFKVFRETVLGPAETLLQFVLKIIVTGRPSLFKHAAVCILDDLVHWLGVKVAPIRDQIVQCFTRALEDPDDNDVRQAAIFGIGMCSEHAPSLFSSFCISKPILRYFELN